MKHAGMSLVAKSPDMHERRYGVHFGSKMPALGAGMLGPWAGLGIELATKWMRTRTNLLFQILTNNAIQTESTN